MQVDQLVKTLASTNPHYIRCIKPNALKVAHNFDSDMVAAQLRYAGMMQTIHIRKMGYPVRISCDHFWKTYRCLAIHGEQKKSSANDDPRSSCVGLLNVLYQKQIGNPTNLQMGKTKVFLRDDQVPIILIQYSLTVPIILHFLLYFVFPTNRTQNLRMLDLQHYLG